MIKIDFSDIIYIESLSDYLKIHLNEKIVITRETITNIEVKLPKNMFIRIHRSYIISIPCIISYTNEYVEIKEKTIPISRSYRKKVMLRLGNS